MEHIRLVDSARAFAAGLVLLSHVAFWTGASSIDLVGPLLARGDAGVAVFFALSAFLLLSPPFSRTLAPGATPRPVTDYLWRRAARILPAYWLALGAVLAVGAVGLAADSPGSFATVAAHLTLTQGLVGEQYQGFSQTWSLTTEVTFYLLVPLIGRCLVRGANPGAPARSVRRGLVVIGIVAVGGLLATAVARVLMDAGHGTAGAALGMSVVGHAAWFAAGAGVALIVQTHRLGVIGRSTATRASWSRSTVVLAAVFVLVLAATPLAGPFDLTAPTVIEAITKEGLYTVFAMLVLIAAVMPIREGSALASFSTSGLNAWLGHTSYGVFLWHVLVLQVLFHATGATVFAAPFGWTLQIVVTLTLVLASLSWFLVEKPVLDAVHRRTRSARMPQP